MIDRHQIYESLVEVYEDYDGDVAGKALFDTTLDLEMTERSLAFYDVTDGKPELVWCKGYDNYVTLHKKSYDGLFKDIAWLNQLVQHSEIKAKAFENIWALHTKLLDGTFDNDEFINKVDELMAQYIDERDANILEQVKIKEENTDE